MYRWIVFLHVLAIFGFLIAHGASAAVIFKLRGERQVHRIRVLLELSRGANSVANAFLMLLLAAGIALGFMGGWWGQYWIWTSLALLVLTSVGMLVFGSGPLIPIRNIVRPDEPWRSRKQLTVAAHWTARPTSASTSRRDSSNTCDPDGRRRSGTYPLADAVQTVLIVRWAWRTRLSTARSTQRVSTLAHILCNKLRYEATNGCSALVGIGGVWCMSAKHAYTPPSLDIWLFMDFSRTSRILLSLQTILDNSLW